jgi:Glycosyl hydrolase family 26
VTRRRLAALVALPAAVLAIGVPVAVGIATSHRPHPVAARRSQPRGVLGGRSKVTGPLVPAAGAYLGAYVQPTGYSWQAQRAAVRSFQRQIGRPLELVHVYHPWPQPFPSPADRSFVTAGKVLLLTWGGAPNTKKIIAGQYDQMITARAEAIKKLHRPILMEFRHEMDRPNLQWAIGGPASYIKAWDHIRAIFRQAGASNVGWVWCPTGYGFQVGRAQAFYPGNSEVDWVCADVYSFSPAQSLRQAAAPFLAWASLARKPIIIGEFAVNGPASTWPTWLMAAGRFAEKYPQIKAIAYFDANGTDSNGNPFTYWLGGHEQAFRAFARLAATAYFRPAIPRESL